MGNFRDGASVTSDAVTLILATIDRIKMLPIGSSAIKPKSPATTAI